MARSTHRVSSGIVALLGLVLLAGWLAIGLHQHESGDVGHSCAVCCAGHTSAVSVASILLALPHEPVCRALGTAQAEGPLEAPLLDHRARAPPLS